MHCAMYSRIALPAAREVGAVRLVSGRRGYVSYPGLREMDGGGCYPPSHVDLDTVREHRKYGEWLRVAQPLS